MEKSVNLKNIDRAKLAAANIAVEYVKDGMNVGLGTGSTAAWMIKCLADKIYNEGISIKAVPTSNQTAKLALEHQIPITTLDEVKFLDITIDGTDECDENYNLIKGGGAALLHEKIVAAASKKVIIIADQFKYVDTLGSFPLPVELIKFGWSSSKDRVVSILNKLGYKSYQINLRMSNNVPLKTDEKNFILDLELAEISEPLLLSRELNLVPGVVENGLFINSCDLLILGENAGKVSVHEPSRNLVSSRDVDVDRIFREFKY